MDLRKLFSASEATVAANPIAVTNTHGAPHGGSRLHSVVETPAAPDVSHLRLSEEVKRRQVALLLRYVMTVRVR